MAPTGVSLMVNLLTLALAAPSACGSPPGVSADRFHGVAAHNTTGHWHSEATVLDGERWTADYEPSPETTVSTKEASTMAAPIRDQVTGVVDLGAMLDARQGAIVTLVSGKTRLAVHRAVLVATSPVFAAMFRHGTQEANTRKVAIPDVEGAVLRQLVGYMYTGRAPQLPGMAHRLLGAADKYGVDSLKDVCEQQLVAQLDLENVATAAVLSVRHSCPILRAAVINFVRGHTDEVMTTQGWAEANQRQPEAVSEFLRLLAKALPETSAAATAADPAAAPTTASDAASTSASSTASAAAHTTATAVTSAAAPTTASSAAPAATPQPTPLHKKPRPNAVAVSCFRSLSARQKGRRLIKAAKKGKLEEVRALLAAGADVGARGEYEWTALHWATDAGHAPVVRLLLAASADPNAREEDGHTPLHVAAVVGRAEAAAALLEAGADRRARDRSGETALDEARRYNRQQVVELLRANT